ncbi:Clp protease N-terminal domain-containing protein [Kribbella sp. VKM Ac-2568]|uniref:Clp protease N-terminal domain-containing protein n=1 Tax=Kribbella sp. VKM Ac-2568 TaxID=2512219 RepID=UPI001053456A|nr:Clp protease N-terminal domain-containing protein [Kribbella sp. VKM Ac-2568]TCM41826.1 ClpA/ClpB-like protein [Kribbella sp. VKM Ac-2568]
MSTKTKDVRSVLVRGARAEARLDGSSMIEAEHVLLALAALPGSAAARMLHGAGLTRDAIRAALDREWEQSLATAGIAVTVAELPTATPDEERTPAIGESTKLLLKRAMDNAAATGGGRIGASNMLVGILDANLGRVPRALDLAGIDRAALRAQATQAAEQGDH